MLSVFYFSKTSTYPYHPTVTNQWGQPKSTPGNSWGFLGSRGTPGNFFWSGIVNYDNSPHTHKHNILIHTDTYTHAHTHITPPSPKMQDIIIPRGGFRTSSIESYRTVTNILSFLLFSLGKPSWPTFFICRGSYVGWCRFVDHLDVGIITNCHDDQFSVRDETREVHRIPKFTRWYRETLSTTVVVLTLTF